MGQLARRIEELLREHGLDPSAWQGEVQSLAALEARDEASAQDRFHEVKRALLVMRRSGLLGELRTHPFALDVPSPDAKGLDAREIEREIRWAAAAVRHARSVARAQEAEAEARAAVKERGLPPPIPIPPRLWDDLAPLVALADDARRAVLRELRVEEEARALARRAQRLSRVRVDVPDTRALPADEALAALAPVERAMREAEALEEAHARVVQPLRAPDVRAYKAQTRRAIEAEADALLAARDLAGLDALERRAQALAREAASLDAQAARARRSGAAAPRGERKAGDTMDGYG